MKKAGSLHDVVIYKEMEFKKMNFVWIERGWDAKSGQDLFVAVMSECRERLL